MRGYYIIGDDHVPVRVADARTWAHWLEVNHPTHVGWTQINSQVTVSTVFLGLDHNWSGRGPPILFETMVFGGERDQECERYCTWDEAEAGHNKFVSELRSRYVTA